MKFNIQGGNPGAKITAKTVPAGDGIVYVDVKLELEEAAIPECFNLTFSVPDIDVYSVWSPSIRFDRHIGPDWMKRYTDSRLASWMPLHALVSADGRNKMTVTVSDAETPISIGTGEFEETAEINWIIHFFTIKVAPLMEYTARIRIDTRDVPYYDSIYDGVSWWESDCGYTPAYVPEHATLPMNSLWYSYHQALDVDDIIKECKLSKEIGMETVIVDDGWQCDDNDRGYHSCGDWEPVFSKVPDMVDFVRRIHGTGMKAMLWFSVPYIGKETRAFERFHDMILDGTGDAVHFWAFDPRYKEVRDYLVSIYAKAVRDWGFDGLKLDFIDAFILKGKSLEDDPRRDCHSLEEGISALLTETVGALKEINPEVMIEFRQTYVGPAVRKYGNMLRVTDCPNDAICNRQDVVNLRYTSGKTAVHSDMLMWHTDDTVESAALEVIGALYSVPQISVKIATLPESHKQMLRFYLSFWRENRDTIINGKIIGHNPESGYSSVWAIKDGCGICTAYTDPIVDCGGFDTVRAVNATRGSSLILKNAAGKSYKVVNCLGEQISAGVLSSDLWEVPAPLAGMILVDNQEA